MRFRRIAIPAYGPFTDMALEFPAGQADFHLIYGGNEAGKSSLLRAVRDLLYGIHAQTADNFRHDYKDLRIAAGIENRAGQRLDFQRRKGKLNTLLDAAGNPLDDAALAPFLGRVDRAFFTTMFGLGAEELRQGAHELLQGRGDLGQTLFSASLAGTPIHRVLAGLDGEAEKLFNGRARVGVSLRPAADALEEALRASRQAQVKAETWEETLGELESALQAKAELDADLHTRRARQDWLRRCLDALPTLGRLRETEARLSDLPPLPVLPAGFAAAAEATREHLAAAEQILGEQCLRRDELLARRQELAPRPEVLAQAGEIDALVAGLAVYRQARDALAVEQAEMARLDASLRTGLLDLGLAGAPAAIAGLRVPLAEQLALREAAAAFEQARSARDAQQRETERLTVELEKTQARAGLLPQGDTAALRAAHAASAAVPALPGQAASLNDLARRLASQHALLAGAPADRAATYALALPAAARLREFAVAAADLASRTRLQQQAQQETARRRRELTAKLARLEQRGALPSHDDLAQARQQREAGWQQVLACWQGGAAVQDWDGAPLLESYPAAVLRADHLADRLREEADAVAQAEELRWQIAETEAAELEQAAERASLELAAQAWERDWNSLWQAVGLTPAGPAEMLEWREQWLEFRNRYEAWRDLDHALHAARLRRAEAEALLRPLLGSADLPLAELHDLAQQRLRAADQVLGEQRALVARQAELQRELEALAVQRTALDAAWAQAEARWKDMPLGGEQPPQTAQHLLDARLALVAQYDAWTRLQDAIGERQRAQDQYEQRAGRAGAFAGLAAADSAEVQVNALALALEQARTLHARRAQVEDDLAQLLARLPHAEQAAAAARRDLDALLAQAGVADLPALQDLLADFTARQSLIAERDGLRATLHVPARGEVLEDFIERVRGEEGATLAIELEELSGRIGEQEALREQLIQTLARASDAKAGLEASGDSAARFLQTARHHAARIRHDAARFLRLRLAARFLHAQIEAFRERNQGPLLARAGDLFREMTGASFSGLGTAYANDDTPTLVGLKDGVTVPVAGMSEGTRDQLYLALRLAAIELHQARHEPMPLILDDLLITFDDHRTRAILPLLRDLAASTQVLLFTHHRHLLDLARETLPDGSVCLHEL